MSHRLRDGTTTEDPRLDRLVDFDERSREYPIRELFGDPGHRVPRSYTWRCNSYLDQGPDGACVGFSMTHELAARPAESSGLDPSFAKNVYLEAQKIDPWPGGEYPGAEPRYSGTSVLAGVKIAHQMGYFDEYRWCFGIDDVSVTLGYHGPVMLGIPWYRNMFSVNSRGYIEPGGDIVGGHAILANAIKVDESRITLHNSWGPGWGHNGECYIKVEHLGDLLQQRGEAVVMIGRHSEPEV